MRPAMEHLRSALSSKRKSSREGAFWDMYDEESIALDRARAHRVHSTFMRKIRRVEEACEGAGKMRQSENLKFEREVSRRFGASNPALGPSPADVWGAPGGPGPGFMPPGSSRGAENRQLVDKLSSQFQSERKAYQEQVKQRMAALQKRRQSKEAAAKAKAAEKQIAAAKARAAAEEEAKAAARAKAEKKEKEKATLPRKTLPSAPALATEPAAKRAWDLRQSHSARKADVKAFLGIKKYQKSIKQARVHINNAAATVKDVCFRLVGTPKNLGLKSLFDTVAERLPAQLDVVQHIVADQLVVKAATQTSSEAIRHGESSFALAYLALALMIDRESFSHFLLASIVSACPYCVPGLRVEIEQHFQNRADLSDAEKKTQRRIALGYKPKESENDYVLRMQALVAWYGAIVQTTPRMLSNPPYSMVKEGHHPWGGMPQCWRWVAGTINGVKWRWTRSLLQAFLAVSGNALCRSFPNQSKKMLHFLRASRTFKAACDKACTGADKDRVAVFTKFIEQSGDTVPPPGNPEDKDHDCRLLPADVIENRG